MTNPKIRFPRNTKAAAVRKQYGTGQGQAITIKVRAANPQVRAKLLKSARSAAREWNQAAGTKVFRVPKPNKVTHGDVTLQRKVGSRIPGNKAAYGAVGRVRVSNKATKTPYLAQTLTHELGHTLGLAHPSTPKTRKYGPYADPRFALSGNLNGVSKREARIARRIVKKRSP